MAIPTYDVRVDWDRNGYGSSGIDVITTDVLSMRRVDVASDVFGGQALGTLTIRVSNADGKYSDLIAASPLFGKLRPRRPVHVTVTPPSLAATGYFDGFVDDIVPIDDPNDPQAEIMCSDWGGGARVWPVEVPRADRSYGAAYAAILAAAGVPSTSIPSGSIMQSIVPNHSLRGNAWEGLTELALATGSRHAIAALPAFVAPTYQFIVRDRLAALEAPAVAALTRGTDFERITEWSGIARAVVNEQTTRSISDRFDTPATVVWSYAGPLPLALGVGQSATIWADLPGPVRTATVTHAGTGTYTVTPTYFERSVKIVIAATTATVVSALAITGQQGVEVSTAAVARDAPSQAIYDVQQGPEISTRTIPTPTLGQGLADWYIERHATPPRVGKIVQEDRPAAFSRSIFDVLAITDPTLGLAGWRCEVIGRELVVDVAGESWTQALTVQELPAQENFFTIGTDAIGGATILGY